MLTIYSQLQIILNAIRSNILSTTELDRIITEFVQLQQTAQAPLKNQLVTPISDLKAYREKIVGLKQILDPMRTSLQKIQTEKNGLVPPAQQLVDLLLITRNVSRFR